ncbi:MAG TPA: twin-arginine translocase TatA/TatE family subunit [Acidimicrobiales bacterium]|jgi:sec-independent protein translocase protein TatA|nr:twin-arginine translocase TatA/TatE family subunit [Acidimicrobiales bacterium]
MTADILSPEILVVIILAIVLLFGVNRLPKMARNLGEANKEFKKAQREAEEETKADEAKAAAAKAEAAKPAAPTDTVTLSKAELDSLLAEREAKARRESGSPSAN